MQSGKFIKKRHKRYLGPHHQKCVLQLYLYGCILVSAQVMLRTTVLKNSWCYSEHDNTLVFLGTPASLVLRNKFEGDQFTLYSLFFGLHLEICFIFTHFSTLSIICIVFTSSGHIYYFIQRPVHFLLCFFEPIHSFSKKIILVCHRNHALNFTENVLILYFS